MKLKDNKACGCSYSGDAEPARTYCRYGYCTILRCAGCNMILVQHGPVACPHKKNENGTLRWYKYPAMDRQAVHWGRRGVRKRKRSNKVLCSGSSAERAAGP